MKKAIITEEQHKGILNAESINFNLSKQLRKRQLKGDVTPALDDIFGKNVFRLYYDLESGRQIFPTRKDPKLKFDVPIIDKLKNSIEGIVNDLGFTLVDFEKNIARNNKTNQQIKISKVITDTDVELQKQYNEYLGALTKKYTEGEKLLVAISRHSHDIGSMSSKPQISSCEDISDFTSISQIPDPDNFYAEGYGTGIIGAIESGSLVFYLIKENDLNIEDPISRFLEGKVCEFGNSSHFYGKYDNNFKNFIINWLRPYYKLRGKSDNEFESDFYSKSVEEINSALRKINSDTQYENILKNLVSNKRFDVISDLMNKSEWSNIDGRGVERRVFDEDKVIYVLSRLSKIYGYKMFNLLPDNLKDIFFNEIKTTLNSSFNELKNTYEILFLDFDKTDLVKKIKAAPEHKEIFQSYLNKNKLTQDDINLAEGLIKYGSAYGDLGKFVDVDLYNKINQYRVKFKQIPNISERIRNYYDKLFALLQ